MSRNTVASSQGPVARKKSRQTLGQCLNATLVIALLLVVPLFAAIAQEPVKLTLSECIQMALKQGKEAQIARSELEAAKSTYQARRLGCYLPRVNFQLTTPSYQNSQSLQNFFGATERVLSKSTSLYFNGGVVLSQNLLTGGTLEVTGRANSLRNTANIFSDFRERSGELLLSLNQPLFAASPHRNDLHQAEFAEKRAQWQYHERVWGLYRDVMQAYVDLLAAGIEADVAGLELEKARMAARDAEEKKTQNLVDEKEVLTARAKTLEQEVVQLDALRKREEKRLALFGLLGMKSEAAVELSGQIVPEAVPADRLEWYRSNASLTLDAKRAALSVDEKKTALEQTRSQGGLGGTLSGSADIGRGKEKRDVTNNINTNRYGVSLTLTYPLWDGGAQAAAERAAEVAYETVKLDREKQIQAAVTKVTSAINKVTTGQKRVELLGRIAELERQRLARAEEQQGQGLLSAKALADLKISALDAQTKYLQAVADHNAAVYELHQSFLEDTPPEIPR